MSEGVSRSAIVFAALFISSCGASGPDIDDNSIAETKCLTEIPRAVFLEGGQANIGSEKTYPEESPIRQVTIQPFEIDAAEVTHAQFAAFVEATGYVTDAEKPQLGFGVPGAAVFKSSSANDVSWWSFVEGANWRQPEGPGSTYKPLPYEPVVQVTLDDARNYAKWAGRRLPSEIEWEYAAKAGADTLYVWGELRTVDGQEQANTWQGAFPIQNTAVDGFLSRAPIGCYKANSFGLYDMIGNVWEWTDSAWGDSGSHVIKGGSFLCAENFCRRYRAQARQAQESDFSTNHIGFRTVK